MSLTTRSLIPVVLAALLALAGCQTPPSPPPATARASAPASETRDAAPTPRVVQPTAIYLAQTVPGDGLVAVPVPEGALYLHARPVLTRNDFTEAAALSDRQGGHFVGLRLTSAGAERLGAVSRAHVGKQLAMVIGRELVAAPRIAGPLDRGILAFEVSSAAVAAELAARIRGDIAQ